jgi:tRNA threonylcarbamoyladenosine modification (KEOPS) complex  Pcc1 subunit
MNLPVTSDIKITFATPTRATVALGSLSVDKELSPKNCQKTFSIDGSTLCVHFACSDVRMLRVAMSSFFDMSKVVIETIEEFD